MAKLTLTDIAGGYSLVSVVNANNALIETALENTLSRDGTTPNTMSADLDMNSQGVTNLPVPTNDQDACTKKYADDLALAVTNASGSFSEAMAYDFSTQIDFYGSGGIRVMDTSETDYIQFAHDGTDFAITQSGTTVFSFPALYGGGAGYYTFNDQIRTLNNNVFAGYDSGGTEYIYLGHDGSTGVVNTSGTSLHISSASGLNTVSFNGTGYFFLEGSAAASDTAGYGQLWVKDDAPNNLYFTDDTGQDIQITDNGSLADTSGVTYGSFTGTLTGYAAGPTGTVYYKKEPMNGTPDRYKITLYIESAISGTSNSTALTMTGLPAAIQSTNFNTRTTPMWCIDNANAVMAMGTIVTAAPSTLSFAMVNTSAIAGSTNWTNSGTKGLNTGWYCEYVI